MSTKNNKRKLDAYRPTFDPHLDIATVVFSHVQCVKTRGNLAVVSKLWRDASKPAAAYPLRFDFDAFPDMGLFTRLNHLIRLSDNDEALSLPYERVVGLLGEAANDVCDNAAMRGSVRLRKCTCSHSNQACSLASTSAALHSPAKQPRNLRRSQLHQ